MRLLHKRGVFGVLTTLATLMVVALGGNCLGETVAADQAPAVTPAVAPAVVPAVVPAPATVPETPAVAVSTNAVTNGTPVAVDTNAPAVPVEVTTNATPTVIPPPPVPPSTTPEVKTVPEMTEAPATALPNWQVGTRFSQFELQDKTRGTSRNGSFFGTITEIKEIQDSSPDKVYVQYRLFKSPVWLGISYDHVAAETMDDTNGDGIPDDNSGDGDMEIKGWVPYLQAAWDNKTRFTPYAQAGLAFFKADFAPNSWGDDHRRWVELDSKVSGVEVGGGLNVKLYKGLSADVFAKYMKVDDIKGDWYYNFGTYGGSLIMTMSYVAYGAGLNWQF